MFWIPLFLVELLALFFLSQAVSKTLSVWFFAITKSQKATIQLLALLFFPGVVVHELAHWFMAGILFVRTGDIEFLPQIQGDTVKLGSVAIAKTDPFRRFLIGVAPVIIGIVAIAFIFSQLEKNVPHLNWQTVLLAYVFFEIGNTMFSSKKDMEGAVGLLVALVTVFSLGFFLGVHVNVNVIALITAPVFVAFLKSVTMLFFVPIGIDALLLGINYTLRRYRRI